MVINGYPVEGVCYDKQRDMYRAYFHIGDKQFFLGRHKSAARAAAVREGAEEMYKHLERAGAIIKLHRAKRLRTECLPDAAMPQRVKRREQRMRRKGGRGGQEGR